MSNDSGKLTVYEMVLVTVARLFITLQKQPIRLLVSSSFQAGEVPSARSKDGALFSHLTVSSQ